MTRKHIVRAPGTDRYLIEIEDPIPGPPGPAGATGPTGATGPQGPAGQPPPECTALGLYESEPIDVPDATEVTPDLAYTDLEDCSDEGAGVVKLGLGGLFLLTLEVTWDGSPAPIPSMRRASIMRDGGSAVEVARTTNATNLYDSVSTIERLDASDNLYVIVYQDDPSAVDPVVARVKLGIVRVAL